MPQKVFVSPFELSKRDLEDESLHVLNQFNRQLCASINSLGAAQSRTSQLVAGLQASPTTQIVYPSWANLPDLLITLTVSGSVQLNLFCVAKSDTPGSTIFFAIFRDGSQVGPTVPLACPTANQVGSISLPWLDPVKPGEHTWQAKWAVTPSGATATADGKNRLLQLVEV